MQKRKKQEYENDKIKTRKQGWLEKEMMYKIKKS